MTKLSHASLLHSTEQHSWVVHCRSLQNGTAQLGGSLHVTPTWYEEKKSMGMSLGPVIILID